MATLKKRADGRYQKSVYIGKDANGKKKYKLIMGKTIKEVNQKAAEIKAKLGKGLDVTAENDTWGDWEKRWLAKMKLTQNENQYNTYTSYLKHFSTLRDIPLCKLRMSDFENIINALYKENPTTHKQTAKKTLHELKATASRVFEYAIDNRVIDFNPVKRVEIPKNAPQEVRRSLTAQEKEWIINTPHRAQLPAMIMLFAGLRRGECLALQWLDIDTDNNTITVHQTLDMQNGKAVIKPGAKTKAGERTVDIPKLLSDYLIEYKRTHIITPFDFVVTNAKGKLVNSTAWKRLWESYMKELNLQHGEFVVKPKSKYTPKGIPFVINSFTAHCLRHTHATDLFYAGYDVLYIQHQMGHSNPETTLNIYTHYVKEAVSNNMDKLNAYLSSSDDDSNVNTETA